MCLLTKEKEGVNMGRVKSLENNRRSDRWIVMLLNNKALLILVVLAIISTVASKGLFFTYDNISSVSRQIAVSTMLGIGFTVVLAAGGVDLSVGHMLSLSGVVYAILSKVMPLGFAIILVVIFTAICGLINGLTSQVFNLPPFIVTLAMAQVYKGFAFLLAKGKSIGGLSAGVKYLGQGMIFDVFPLSFLFVIIVTAFVALLLYRTRYGRHVIAVGGNPSAASVSGINVKAIRTSTYIVMSICAAIGAIILTGRVSTATPGAGDGMEMDAIAAVVIGGTPMSGGKAKVVGTVFGCLTIGIMNNLLNLLDVSPFWQWVAKGLIIILAILMDAQTEAFVNRKRKLL